ncbi:MAG: DUF1254 domain-containing protein [Gammaproteobacteria bacterium]|nr:MAG: DUF1254 domain-containing protein [Gammaproteobacteria bacterium]
MKTMKNLLMLSLILAIFGCSNPKEKKEAKKASSSELTADEAKSIAKEAYIFNYSQVMMYRTMYRQAIDTKSKSYVGFGKWLHLGVSSPKDQDIVAPNNDTPYSWAWVDTRAEPWVLTIPKIEKNRFYTSQWDDMWSFVLGNAGSDVDGNDGVTVLLASPKWDGKLPNGVKRVIKGDTYFLGSLTRTQLFDLKDLPNVKKIQQGYKLQTLSTYLGKTAPKAAPAIKWMTWTDGDEKIDKFWSYTNFLLSYSVPNPQDKPVLDRMAKIGLVDGKDWNASSFDKDISTAIAAGMKEAIDSLDKAALTIADPSLFFRSRKDSDKDYFDRALGAHVGIFGNVKEQSVYYPFAKDDKGVLFDGSKHNYQITFTKDQIPPVKNFWSWTMYKLPQRWLVDNPLDRYSIGSATPGLKTASDGSITIYMQAKSPGKDKESNWLPAPEGPFWPVLRTYGPGKTILNKTYKVPAIKQVN